MPSSGEGAEAEPPEVASLVPADRVAAMWPAIRPWIEAALSRGAGEYAAEDVRDYLEAGYWQLFVSAAPDGLMAAAACEVVDYPRRRLLNVQAAGGRVLRGIGAMWPVVRAYAALHGCAAVVFHGRRGWARVGDRVMPPGWRHMQDVIVMPVEA